MPNEIHLYIRDVHVLLWCVYGLAYMGEKMTYILYTAAKIVAGIITVAVCVYLSLERFANNLDKWP